MKFLIKKLEWKYKNNKFLYYTRCLMRELIPLRFFPAQLSKKLKTINDFDFEYIKARVNYYNKLSFGQTLSSNETYLSELKITQRPRAYYFDSYEFTRYFDPKLKAKFLFGDVTHIPSEPSIVKSRPIAGDNANSVLLKLDKIRHFIFTKDKMEFGKKKNILIGRSVVGQEHRIRFYAKYFNHPLCNLGQINRDKNKHWIKDGLTISEHLDYKFILCIEGNDVASNLKWVMSSNSLAVMPKPTYETWFMEGRLIPNYHYIQIKDDYSDFEERLMFYIQNTDEALKIVRNAYVNQFKNRKRENLISLLVLEKYFYSSQQLTPISERSVFKP